MGALEVSLGTSMGTLEVSLVSIHFTAPPMHCNCDIVKLDELAVIVR